MLKRYGVSCLITAFLICLVVSCGKSPTSSGQDLLREGKYKEAMDEFAKAMQEDPLDPDARYYHAKATLYWYDLSIIDCYQFTNNINSDSLDITKLDYNKVNNIYKVNIIIKDDLKPIYENKTRPGFYGKHDILLDYFVANTVVSVLGFFDIFPNDGEIDDFNGTLINTIQDLVSGNFDTTNIESLKAEITSDPEKFNEALDAIKENFDDSKGMILELVTQDLDAEVEIDTQTFNQSLEGLFGLIDQYKLTPGADDDGDFIDMIPLGDTTAIVWKDSINADGRISDSLGVKITKARVISENLKPPYGEWKSGDWGVDEELLDGKDNDSDGTTDEDYHF